MRTPLLIVFGCVVLVHAAQAAPPRVDPCAGIERASVRSASGGYLMTFRYAVRDVALAAPFFDKGLKPRLVDRASKVALAMPEDTRLGALRSSPRSAPTVGKRYFVLFSNPARSIGAGSRVDVVVGACVLKDLVVE